MSERNLKHIRLLGLDHLLRGNSREILGTPCSLIQPKTANGHTCRRVGPEVRTGRHLDALHPPRIRIASWQVTSTWILRSHTQSTAHTRDHEAAARGRASTVYPIHKLRPTREGTTQRWNIHSSNNMQTRKLTLHKHTRCKKRQRKRRCRETPSRPRRSGTTNQPGPS